MEASGVPPGQRNEACLLKQGRPTHKGHLDALITAILAGSLGGSVQGQTSQPQATKEKASQTKR